MNPSLIFSARRRNLLGATLMLPALLAGQARAHTYVGVVKPPKPAPKIQLTDLDGTRKPMQAWLNSPLTAVQLMFTGCSATCPIQGAMFAHLQQQLDAASLGAGQVQLLSISIDPLNDDAKAMRAWLNKYAAQAARWRAALPTMPGVEQLFDFLEGRAIGADRHASRVYLFDQQGQFIYRTEELPAITSVMQPITLWFKAKLRNS